MTRNNAAHVYSERHRLATKIVALDMLGGKCAMCGERRILRLEFDHIVPRRGNLMRKTSSGSSIAYDIYRGAENLANLQILCGSCHLEKTYYEGQISK